MKTAEIKQLLQSYFEGTATVQEEQELAAYFNSEDVADELLQFTGFFKGLSQLRESFTDDDIIKDIENLISINNSRKKTGRLPLWQILSGIAASVIIVLSGYLFIQQNEQQYSDTFNDPEVAYTYAVQTLSYVSVKYNHGLAALTNFNKLQTAAEPLQKGMEPINAYMEIIENMKTTNTPEN